MTTILITNDTLAPTDFTNVLEALSRFLAKFTPAWKLDVKVITDGTVAHDMVVNITDKGRRLGAAGFHNVVAGVPTSWCSPKSSGRIYGHYSKPLIVKGKQLRAETFTPGLVATLCHEVSEMLVDPVIANYSAKDSLGREWLIEVGDHVFGSYKLEIVAGNNCSIPDATTPAFYDLAGKAPFSIFGGAKAPFTMTPKGYGYYKGVKGLTKI